jgi:hypothetical protein
MSAFKKLVASSHSESFGGRPPLLSWLGGCVRLRQLLDDLAPSARFEGVASAFSFLVKRDDTGQAHYFARHAAAFALEQPASDQLPWEPRLPLRSRLPPGAIVRVTSREQGHVAEHQMSNGLRVDGLAPRLNSPVGQHAVSDEVLRHVCFGDGLLASGGRKVFSVEGPILEQSSLVALTLRYYCNAGLLEDRCVETLQVLRSSRLSVAAAGLALTDVEAAELERIVASRPTLDLFGGIVSASDRLLALLRWCGSLTACSEVTAAIRRRPVPPTLSSPTGRTPLTPAAMLALPAAPVSRKRQRERPPSQRFAHCFDSCVPDDQNVNDLMDEDDKVTRVMIVCHLRCLRRPTDIPSALI